MCVSLIPLSVSPSSVLPFFLLLSQSCLTISLPPGLCVPVSLSLSVVFALLLAGSCISEFTKANHPLPCLDVHLSSALSDLAGQGADEHERFE